MTEELKKYMVPVGLIIPLIGAIWFVAVSYATRGEQLRVMEKKIESIEQYIMDDLIAEREAFKHIEGYPARDFVPYRQEAKK